MDQAIVLVFSKVTNRPFINTYYGEYESLLLSSPVSVIDMFCMAAVKPVKGDTLWQPCTLYLVATSAYITNSITQPAATSF